MSKKIIRSQPSFEEDSQLVLKDPLQAKKHHSALNVKCNVATAHYFELDRVGRSQFVGLEDFINDQKVYRVTATCEKQSDLYYLSYADFRKLKTISMVCGNLDSIAKNRIDRLTETIVASQKASSNMSTRIQ